MLFLPRSSLELNLLEFGKNAPISPIFFPLILILLMRHKDKTGPILHKLDKQDGCSAYRILIIQGITLVEST